MQITTIPVTVSRRDGEPPSSDDGQIFTRPSTRSPPSSGCRSASRGCSDSALTAFGGRVLHRNAGHVNKLPASAALKWIVIAVPASAGSVDRPISWMPVCDVHATPRGVGHHRRTEKPVQISALQLMLIADGQTLRALLAEFVYGLAPIGAKRKCCRLMFGVE